MLLVLFAIADGDDDAVSDAGGVAILAAAAFSRDCDNNDPIPTPLPELGAGANDDSADDGRSIDEDASDSALGRWLELSKRLLERERDGRNNAAAKSLASFFFFDLRPFPDVPFCF